jgi:integrase
MAKLNFYLREKTKDGDTPIILFISFNSNRLKYPTGKVIHPKFWNEGEQIARQVKDFPLAKILNEHLKFLNGTAEKELETLANELQRPPSIDELKKRLDEVLNPSEASEEENRPPTFLELFKRFIQDSETGIRLTSTGKRFDKRSIQKYNTTYSVLETFGKKYHLTFDTIDKNFYTKFVDFLNKPIYGKDKKVIKASFSLNNVGKYIQVIKTFLNYATENGYNSNLYYQSKQFKAHKVPGFSIYLNEKELIDLYNFDLSSQQHYERVRDLFLVGCWTGLRFSDFTSIKPENVKGDFLHIKTFKTGEPVIIPIHGMVKSIMAKYSDKYPNSLPPAIANQKMNSYLKEIAKKVDSLKVPVEVEGIKGGLKVTSTKYKWELVTTHTARRSFATNVYKSGFPAISLMKITGHRTEKSFLLYIKVTPEENAQKLLDHWNKSILKVS